MSSIDLHSQVSGLSDGPGLLLSNSLATTMGMWRFLLPMLESRFKIVRYDTRGHGKSPTPTGPYTFDDLVDDAFSVMDNHELDSATVMGCSLGGMTALGMGLSRPERVERIICTAARADAPQLFKKSWDDRVKLMNEKGVAVLWDGSVAIWLTLTYKEAHPDVVAQLRAEFLMTTPEGYSGCASALKELDYLKDLGTMKVPALFVAGSDDDRASPATMQEMASACSDGQFALVKNSGHIVAINNAADLYTCIYEYIGPA